MLISGVIYTTNKAKWVKSQLPDIYKVILGTKGITLNDFKIVEITLPNVVPTIDGGVNGVGIDFEWMKSTYATDGTVLCLHISPEERNRLKLTHPVKAWTLGGLYNKNIGDSSMEFLVIADTYREFHRIFLHELSHGFAHWSSDLDETHHYDFDLHNIESIYPTYDFKRNNILSSIVDILKKVVGLQKQINAAPGKRLDKDYPVTQGYGAANPIYKFGIHIGKDWACPVGTVVRAPLDGEVTVSGTLPEVGNYCLFVYQYEGITYVDRLCHLNAVPTTGLVKKGQPIAISGNTGLTTGPHCHIDTWKGGFAINNINKDNWKTLTVNPDHLYSNPQE